MRKSTPRSGRGRGRLSIRLSPSVDSSYARTSNHVPRRCPFPRRPRRPPRRVRTRARPLRRAVAAPRPAALLRRVEPVGRLHQGPHRGRPQVVRKGRLDQGKHLLGRVSSPCLPSPREQSRAEQTRWASTSIEPKHREHRYSPSVLQTPGRSPRLRPSPATSASTRSTPSRWSWPSRVSLFPALSLARRGFCADPAPWNSLQLKQRSSRSRSRTRTLTASPPSARVSPTWLRTDSPGACMC